MPKMERGEKLALAKLGEKYGKGQGWKEFWLNLIKIG